MPSPGVLPPEYPPPFPSNYKSLRFYATGTPTANFVDNQFSFERPDPKDPSEPEQGFSQSIRIVATSGNIEYSFDGTNVHGFVPGIATKVGFPFVEQGRSTLRLGS